MIVFMVAGHLGGLHNTFTNGMFLLQNTKYI